MKKVFFDASPLQSGHAHRGIGGYTRSLQAALRKEKTIELVNKPEQADVVHYPYFDFFAPTLSVDRSVPTVVTVHDVIPLMFPKQYPSGIKGMIALWRQKQAVKNAKLIVTDSLASQQEIVAKLGVAKSKVKVVPLAADPSLNYQDSKQQQKVARKYELPDRFILYVGDINYNKNLPMLIEAFAQLNSQDPTISLVLVGKNFRPQPIPEWQAVTDAIAHHKLGSVVSFLTKVDSTVELAAIYSQARVYVQPSLAEGFGLPLLEAMQCYCPVVCFNQSSMVEVAAESAIYPKEVSATALSEAINSVLKWSGVERHRWVAKAYSWSRTFTWKKAAEAMVALYHQL